MAAHSDLTFITNENKQNLLERFKVLIEDTEFFDVLVGYFYTSGFHALYQALEKTRKIRILIGISTNNAEQRPFIRLVDRILTAKAADPKADTTKQEAEIDKLVYALYGLTAEEIAAVENQ